ncbi:MAG: sugar transferase, partial [Bacteroidota bacterium]
MNRQRQLDTFIYRIADYLTALLAWVCFFVYRKQLEGDPMTFWEITGDQNFILGSLLIPLGWISFYAIFDQYQDVYRLSRLATLARTLFLSFFGVLFLFFTLILDDFVTNYKTYYTSFLTLFLLHFSFTAIIRMVLLTRASWKLKAGKVKFNTLIIGGNENAVDLFQEITAEEKSLGYHFIGFIDANGNSTNELSSQLPVLGKIENMAQVIEEHNVEEVIIAIETSEHNRLREILNVLFDFDRTLLVKIIPDMYDIMLGTVKMNHVFGAVLIEISRELMPRWQRLIKRTIDVVASGIMLILLSPVYAYVALRVKLSSQGPIIYKQERIGLNKLPFNILKFRSMYTDAESAGPKLSFDGDNRCTPWGAVMRKWRLDERPPFWNVLKGVLSLVGPR